MTSQKHYGEDDKDVEAGKPVADKPGVWKPPAKMPTQDAWRAWRVTQGALNSLGLAEPYLKVDGIPGPETLKAAQGLAPLIQHVMKQPS